MSRSNGAVDDFVALPMAHKRGMSWLLAAVMSICEEDQRKCRALQRGRHRLRVPVASPGGAGSGNVRYVVVDADTGALMMQLLHSDEVLKRSTDDLRRGLEIVPVTGDRLTVRRRTGNFS